MQGGVVAGSRQVKGDRPAADGTVFDVFGIALDLPATDPLRGALTPGIAMYVARRLIEAMRGTTWVTEGAGGSVEIGFSLPCYESAT